MALYPKCSQSDCFANQCGTRCNILTENPSYPCSFYKTPAELEIQRQEAHQHLKDIDRYDLIEKYEYNNGRDW